MRMHLLFRALVPLGLRLAGPPVATTTEGASAALAGCRRWVQRRGGGRELARSARRGQGAQCTPEL